MGFQLGPKFLRRAPKGWIPARAFPIKHSAYEHQKNDPEGGESVLETSAGLTVTWRVEADGHAPYEFSEKRSAPTWLLQGITGGGKRWYSLRIRPQYGLMKDVGVPGVVNPEDPHELWVDWDRAYEEHEVAWAREARVQREKARRSGAFDHAIDRVVNPFAGRLRPEDEARVEEAIAQEKAGYAEVEGQRKWTPEARRQAESIEVTMRMEDLGRIKREGRKVRATVVGRDDTGRTFGSIPVIMLTFALDEGGAPRQVVFEHVFGPQHANRYQPGKEVDVWIDPLDRDAICPGD